MFDELEDEELDILPLEKADYDEDRLQRPSIGEVW